MELRVAGENSLILYFGNAISPAINDQVQRANKAIRSALADVLVDTVASYASLLVIFDVLRCDHAHIQQRIEAALVQADNSPRQANKVLELPVYYSHESGPDLATMAQQLDLSVEAIIDIHQAQEYRVYAIGFAPGFAYMGQVDERIACPRLASPRLRVPKGAVAIADRQTAVYPAASPGGWNIVGACPVSMFQPESERIMPLAVGDTVRFKAISRQQFIAMGGEFDDAASAMGLA